MVLCRIGVREVLEKPVFEHLGRCLRQVASGSLLLRVLATLPCQVDVIDKSINDVGTTYCLDRFLKNCIAESGVNDERERFITSLTAKGTLIVIHSHEHYSTRPGSLFSVDWFWTSPFEAISSFSELLLLSSSASLWL